MIGGNMARCLLLTVALGVLVIIGVPSHADQLFDARLDVACKARKISVSRPEFKNGIIRVYVSAGGSFDADILTVIGVRVAALKAQDIGEPFITSRTFNGWRSMTYAGPVATSLKLTFGTSKEPSQIGNSAIEVRNVNDIVNETESRLTDYFQLGDMKPANPIKPVCSKF